MSLLDDVSIVVTPNGYKAGELYAVIPSSGAADLEVTRGTAATRVDENGLVNYAEIIGDSVLTGNNSNFDTGIGSWLTYIGGSLAHDTDKLEVTLLATGSGARINTNSLISGGQAGKTFKVRAKIWQGTTTATQLNVYLGGAQDVITVSSTPTYFEIELTPINTGFLTIYRGSSSGGTFFIDDVTVKEVTRDNVPRIDYTGGGCPHILAEPMRTNLITYSEDFSQWSTIGSTIESDNTTSPDGTVNADRITSTSTGDSAFVRNIQSTQTVSTVYSYSCFVKKGTTDFVRLANRSLGNVSEASCWFDIQNGVVGDVGSNVSSTEIESFGDGWYKCTVIGTTGGTISTQLTDIAAATSNGNASATTGDYIYYWGAQLEQGSYPTSYIPTSGQSGGVTRNQDIFTRDGIGSLINSTEGTFFVEMARQEGDTAAGIISLNNGTATQTVALYYFSTGTIAFDILSSSPNISGTSSPYNTYNFNKIALKYKSGDISLWVNGVEVVTKTNTFSLLPLTNISFDYGSGANKFFGKVKQLQVYDTALTDEQLLQLTGESGTDFYESYAEMASALTYTIQ